MAKYSARGKSSRKKLYSIVTVVSVLSIGSFSAWFIYSKNALNNQSNVASAQDSNNSEDNKSTNKDLATKKSKKEASDDSLGSNQPQSEQGISVPVDNHLPVHSGSNATSLETPNNNSSTTNSPAPVCNQAMRESYESLYNSQVSAENTRWSRQIERFRSEAAASGRLHGGYVQSQIEIHEPTHNLRLSEIETTYAYNLSSINCL